MPAMKSAGDAEVRFLRGHERYRGPKFALVDELYATPDGEVERPVIHHPGAVAILAEPEPGLILMVRQFRYAIRAWTLEIPAGTRVPGEAPEATAARELEEESGYRAGRLSELLRFHPAVGVSDEEMVLYRAENLTAGTAAPDPGELVRRELVPRDRLPEMLAAGTRFDAKTLIALALIGILPRPGHG